MQRVLRWRLNSPGGEDLLQTYFQYARLGGVVAPTIFGWLCRVFVGDSRSWRGREGLTGGFAGVFAGWESERCFSCSRMGKAFRQLQPVALVEETHRFAEWRDPHGSSLPISVREILQALGEPEEEIDAIVPELGSFISGWAGGLTLRRTVSARLGACR